MAPSKFVAPLKRNGDGTSMSLSFSSGSSLGKEDPKRAGPVVAVVQQVPQQSSEAPKQADNDPSCSVNLKPAVKATEAVALGIHGQNSVLDSSKNLSEAKPSGNVKIAEITGADSSEAKAADKLNIRPAPVARNMMSVPHFSRPKPLQKPSEISKIPDKLPKKKSKLESAPSTSSTQKSKRSSATNDDDKENVIPAKRMRAPKPASGKPCVSLTDAQYDFIFRAVLVQCQDDDTDPTSADPEKTGEISRDMFEDASQSDLDDLEEEPLKKANQEKHFESSTEDGQSNSSETAATCRDEKFSDETTKQSTSALHSTVNLDEGTDATCNQNTSKIISHSGSSQEDSRPLVNHPSKSNSIVETSCVSEVEKMNHSSQPQSSCSQEYAAERESFITSTPLTAHSKPPATLSPFATPKKIVSRPLSMSQEENLPSATSQFSTPIKPRSESQEMRTTTPTLTPKTHHQRPSVSQTPQNSIPIRGSSTLSTPSCSQQITQEIKLTPPPAGKTARERLVWLQKKRLADGVWVQCDNDGCKKWRHLADCQDPATLPEKWYCEMHPDEDLNNCEAPEKRLSLQAEEDMIFNEHSPGSLVWAKLSGFPWWPAMVEDDPDVEVFFWLNTFSDIPTWYHVVFFDNEKHSVQRAWVPVERLKSFSKNMSEECNEETRIYKKRVRAAYEIACSAQLLSVEDRLTKFSFASRYKGPIGVSSKWKYDGPLGYRKRTQ